MIFPDTNRIYQLYPAASKYKIFLPFFYTHRLFKNTLGNKRGLCVPKYKAIKSQNRGTVKDVRNLLENLELKK